MKQPGIDGPRACTQADLPGVISVADAALREGSNQTFLTDYPLVYRPANLANVSILKVDGQVVSVVPFIPWQVVVNDCRFSLGIIFPTATAPQHRKKGYGLQCLNRSVGKMMADGVNLSILWTLIPTFRFYEHADYQGVHTENCGYDCSLEDSSLFTDHGEKVIEYNPQSQQYIDDVQVIHEQEPYGALRPNESYAVLLSLPKMKTLLALRDGKPTAYLVFSRAPNKPGVVESGGNPEALQDVAAPCAEFADSR